MTRLYRTLEAYARGRKSSIGNPGTEVFIFVNYVKITLTFQNNFAQVTLSNNKVTDI